MKISPRRFGALLVPFVLIIGLLVNPSPASASHVTGNHWAHDGLAHSQIYFVDHTPAFWPVSSSVYKWNEARGVDSYYHWANCPNTRLHCVDVYEYLNDDGNYGVTYWSASGGHFTSATVYLSRVRVTNAHQARKTTCHELGHVLGLDHRAESSSCMRSGNAVTLNISRYPDTHDFNQLYTMYNHAN